MLKYKSSGGLIWSKQYNGLASNADIPTSVAVGNNNDIFIGASSEGTNSLADYLTLKYSSQGAIQWTNRYDKAQLIDVPVKIDFNDNNDVIISGGSASNSQNWDFTTLQYASTGLPLDTVRKPSPGPGFDQPADMNQGIHDNFYITGSGTSGATDHDIKTLKLNDTLGIDWTKTIDGYGLEDGANAMDIGPNGHVYITGFLTHQEYGKMMFTVKYDSTGYQKWAKKYSFKRDGLDEMGKNISVNYTGDVYVSGMIDDGQNKNMVTVKYNENGRLE